MLIDLHVHTNFSDGFDIGLADVIERCKARGIDALVLAECDVIPDLAKVQAIADAAGFPVFVGVDIDASDGRLIAVPLDPTDKRFQDQTWRRGDDDTSIAEVVKVMTEIDGVVLAAHPYMDDGGPALGDRIFRTRGLSGVEILCGVDDDLANDLVLEAAATLALPTFGGSDTGPDGQRVGVYATAFAAEVQTQKQLVAALKEGSYWAVELRRADGAKRSAPPRSGGRSDGHRSR